MWRDRGATSVISRRSMWAYGRASPGALPGSGCTFDVPSLYASGEGSHPQHGRASCRAQCHCAPACA
eukprot:7338262-Prymnesium_polylepis.2